MRVITDEIKVVVFVLEDRFGFTSDDELREFSRFSLQLFFCLNDMVCIKMNVTARPDEFFSLQTALLRVINACPLPVFMPLAPELF